MASHLPKSVIPGNKIKDVPTWMNAALGIQKKDRRKGIFYARINGQSWEIRQQYKTSFGHQT